MNDYIEKVMSIKEDSLLAVYGSVNERILHSRERLNKISSESIEGTISVKNDIRAAIIQHLADSLYNKAQVKRYLYPPKQPKCVVGDLNVRYRGNLNAATTFIVASDFDCKRCVDFEKTLRRIYDKYKERVKFDSSILLMSLPLHPYRARLLPGMVNSGSSTMLFLNTKLW